MTNNVINRNLPTVNGQLMIGNTSTGSSSVATITAGTNITVTNGNGTIQIDAAGGGGFDPSTTYTHFADFINIAVGANGVSNISSGGSSGSHLGTVGDTSHPGIWELEGGTSTGYAGINLNTTASAFTAWKLGGGEITTQILIKTEAGLGASSTDSYQLDFGFTDSGQDAIPSDFAFITFQYNVNSGCFVGTTRSASGTTYTTNDNVTVQASTWYTLKIVVNAAANSITFYRNGVAFSGGALTQGIPTTVYVAPMMRIRGTQSNTTRRYVYIDYWYTTQTLTTPR